MNEWCSLRHCLEMKHKTKQIVPREPGIYVKRLHCLLIFFNVLFIVKLN